MRKVFGALAFLLLMTLCACTSRQQAEAEAEAEALRAALQTRITALEESNSRAEAENRALRAELEEQQAQVEKLSGTIYELTCLKPGGEVYLLGQRTAAMTDGESLYLDAALLPEGDFDAASCREQEGICYVQAEEFCEVLDLRMGTAPDGLVYYAREKHPVLPESGYAVPVLMYHAVGDDCWGYKDLFVRTEELEAQFRYLTEEGFDPIWFEDLSHLEDYDKPVILTFDDGYDDNYTLMLPLVRQYGVKVTVFVIGSAMEGMQHKMTAAQVQEMAQSGLVSIQSHTYTHHDLSAMDEEETRMELEFSRDAIAAVTGEVPYVLCYPEGRHQKLTVDIAKEYYTYGIRMNGYLYHTGDDPFEVNRFFVSRDTDLSTFAAVCKEGIYDKDQN